MSKKNRNEKEAARLRREVEMLKAQLKAARPEWERPASVVERATASRTEPVNVGNFRTNLITDYSYLRNDLVRTGVLSALAFASIFLIYFYQASFLPR